MIMEQQCYLINDSIKFYFEPQDPYFVYKKNKLPLIPLEAKVLKFIFDKQVDGVISVQSILDANWSKKTDKKVLMKLLFGLRKKFRTLGLAEDGFIVNGPHYLILYKTEFIDGYLHELKEMQTGKTRVRRYISYALLFLLALVVIKR